MHSLKGKLLIASPHLLDSNFAQAVVLMVQHTEEGALGVVLNRPSESTIGHVWTELLERPLHNQEPIFLGGPCPGPLMAVHKHPLCIDLEIAEELYFATQREHLETLVEEEIAPLRVFSGYSGWAASQLEAELEVGSWLVAEGTEEALFGDPADLWKTLSRRVGENILFTTLGIKEAPSDPSVN
jgi:putative transcriptional regulator